MLLHKNKLKHKKSILSIQIFFLTLKYVKVNDKQKCIFIVVDCKSGDHMVIILFSYHLYENNYKNA